MFLVIVRLDIGSAKNIFSDLGSLTICMYLNKTLNIGAPIKNNEENFKDSIHS